MLKKQKRKDGSREFMWFNSDFLVNNIFYGEDVVNQHNILNVVFFSAIFLRCCYDRPHKKEKKLHESISSQATVFFENRNK